MAQVVCLPACGCGGASKALELAGQGCALGESQAAAAPRGGPVAAAATVCLPCKLQCCSYCCLSALGGLLTALDVSRGGLQAKLLYSTVLNTRLDKLPRTARPDLHPHHDNRRATPSASQQPCSIALPAARQSRNRRLLEHTTSTPRPVSQVSAPIDIVEQPRLSDRHHGMNMPCP